ncbi:hypothetical protein [Mesorhizobium sp. WSM4906]|uniref:hypothetical protein n=1 Tax=Mesorhizobium sp. WSM4906 TaxID=3038546 RepID=UPI002416E9E6|nr:hypothetical protein [Mesorhizobium sp. WSM4906]WFP76998.1 hypothetical protein QAZ22_03875 [Mesorhizobium sp. WSM4906]
MLLAVLAAVLFAMRLAVADLFLVGLVAAAAWLGGDRMWGDALAGGFAFKSADENVEAIGHRPVLPPPGNQGLNRPLPVSFLTVAKAWRFPYLDFTFCNRA